MSNLWIHGSCPQFDISDELLAERMKLYRPIYLNEKGCPFYMVVPERPRNTAYMWDPKELKPILEWREVARFETHHRCGYIGLFKPSIDEVLAQIPVHLLDGFNAFTTLKGDCVACYNEGDGHRSITVLYSAPVLDEDQMPYDEDIGAYLRRTRP